MKKAIKYIVIIVLLIFGSFFIYKKYNEVPNEYLKFNEYGITYDYNENFDDYGKKYFYNQLDQTEKIYYQCFYNTAKSIDVKFEFNCEFDEEKFNRAWKAFQLDFSEFYWWCNWYKEDRYLENSMSKQFPYSIVIATGYAKTDVVDAYPIIEEKAKEIINEIKTDDDYETIKNLHDYIVLNTKYDLESASNQNIRSVFLFNESVCAGYAQAFQYISNMMGYECYSISGKTAPYEESAFHEWNLIHMKDNWYWIDTTWDEQYDEDGNEIGVNKDYLFLDDEILFIDHKPECDFNLPQCKDKSLYYLNEAGVYFDTYDEDLIEGKMKEWISKRYHEFHFKFLSKEDVEEFYDYVDNGKFFDFYEKKISNYYDLHVNYSYNIDTHLVLLYWKDLY